MIARNDYGTSGDTDFFRLTGIKKSDTLRSVSLGQKVRYAEPAKTRNS